MDQMVLTTQKWLNQTYTGIDGWAPVTEDGITGWETVTALLEALQIELGITSLSSNFGSTTTSLFTPLQYTDGTTVNNKNYILQGALWCKGIGPGSWTGIFDQATEDSVKSFQEDAGITQDGIVTAMIMKALLNMDAFVLVLGGDPGIREIQQSLNAKYNKYFGLVSCDGIYERSTNQALIYALQAEEGLSPSVANGVFGPTTTADCPTLSPGDSRHNFVYILQWALYCNGYDPNGFDGLYGNGVESAVSNFQSFMALTPTGIADMPTIKALLSSAGDTSRAASACDTATILTSDTAKSLVNAGYQYVGRYLTGTVGTGSTERSKALTSSELTAILDSGLKVFVIYEDGGYELDYFTDTQGQIDAQLAISAASSLGVPRGTTIYFAVDFDALDTDVANHVLPYFQAIRDYFNTENYPQYKIGVYGSRNTCTRVFKAGYADFCFVADMSTGYSGNLGFTMPTYWSFDQFATRTIRTSSLEIDADTYSGLDAAIDSIVDPSQVTPNSEDLYNARIQKITQLTNIVSLLQGLPTTNFEFDQSYTLYPVDGITVTFTASESLQAVGSDYYSFTVSNGSVSTSFTSALNTMKVDSNTQSQYISLVDSIAQSMGSGTISLSTSTNGTTYTLKMSIQYDSIPISDNFKITMSTSFSITWDYTNPNLSTAPAVPDTSPLLATVGTFAMLAVGAALLVAFAPEILAGTLVGDFAGAVTSFLGAI